jgi:hypothetical protein
MPGWGIFNRSVSSTREPIQENVYIQGSLTLWPFTASIPAKGCFYFLGMLQKFRGSSIDKTSKHQIQEVRLIKQIPGTGTIQR